MNFMVIDFPEPLIPSMTMNPRCWRTVGRRCDGVNAGALARSGGRLERPLLADCSPSTTRRSGLEANRQNAPKRALDDAVFQLPIDEHGSCLSELHWDERNAVLL
jgi:hypothetical protein